MAYDADAFQRAFLAGAEPPIAIEGAGGWSIASLQTDRTRAAVNLIATRGAARLSVFVERKVEGAACLVATGALMLSYYREPGCDDAEAARVVRALAAQLARREEVLGEGAATELRVEDAAARTRPTGNLELRINRECNEACLFCNTPEGSDTILPSREAVLEAIDRERAAGWSAVTFTGREPTLDPALPEYVRRARQRGYRVVRVQTNGTGFAHAPLLERLIEAGMTHAEISLHTLEEETFARLVGAPRMLTKTLEGLRNLAAYPSVGVRLVIVLTTLNLEALPSLLARVVREIPSVDGVTLSPMAPVGDGALHVDLVPRLTSLEGPLREALAIARAAGIEAVVPSRCGAPICAMPEGFEAHNEETTNVPHRTLEAGKVKGAACARCACDAICTGVWAAQLARHGEVDLRPRASLPVRG